MKEMEGKRKGGKKAGGGEGRKEKKEKKEQKNRKEKRKRKKKKVRWNFRPSAGPEQSELQEKCRETHNNNTRAGNPT